MLHQCPRLYKVETQSRDRHHRSRTHIRAADGDPPESKVGGPTWTLYLPCNAPACSCS